jgi:spermidine synthase/predicted MFS family arabinose efflux permease
MTSLELTTAPDAAKRSERLAQWTRVLCVLFFFSGFPALIYQVTWQRQLFLIFGVNIESVTIVVTAFMLGLGLGSLAGGWLSKRPGIPPLPLLAAIELLTGAFGVVSLSIFDKAGEWMIGLSLPATAAGSLALVIVPTLLMGATLPVLVSHLVRRSGNIGSAVGLLYYVNTLGAGAACLVSAVLLFPFLGMSGSIYVAAAINLTVAIGALAAHWLDGRNPEAAVPATAAFPERRGAGLGLAKVSALAAAGGFVSLSYEIFFFRTVSYATGSSATAFAVTLSAFLVGIASGSRQAGEYCETSSRAAIMRRMVDTLLMASLAGILFLPLLNMLAWLDSGIVGVAILMVYLVARFWGSLLPYLAEVSIACDSRAGMRTAMLYLANILGSAAGSVLTGFVLMNYLGLVAIDATLALAGIGCVLLLVVTVDIPLREKRQRAALAAVFGIVAAIAIPRLSGDVLENLQAKEVSGANSFTEVVENRSGIITVVDHSIVFGNGMYDGRFNTDLVHDINGIVRPFALSLFHPAPRDVLMIGLATGSWAQVLANNPDVASLTIVEINPGYLTLIAHAPEVASVLNNPKVKIIIDDGRRWLRAHPNRHFDAVVSNTTWYFRASVTNLLSVEFLDLVRHHLNPGGIFFYNTTSSDRVQRTACLTFAQGARFTNHMVVSDTPIAWDFQRWRRTLASYRIDGRPVFDPARDQDRAELGRLVSWQSSLAPGSAHTLDRPIEPCADVLARTAGKLAVTDDNMGSEWLHFLGLE